MLGDNTPTIIVTPAILDLAWPVREGQKQGRFPRNPSLCGRISLHTI